MNLSLSKLAIIVWMTFAAYISVVFCSSTQGQDSTLKEKSSAKNIESKTIVTKQSKADYDLDKIKAQIEAAVKAGKITEQEAQQKYKALFAKDAKPGKPIAKPEGNGKEDFTKQAYADFIEKLAELVESGKLTKAEATILYNSVVKQKSGFAKPGINGKDYKVDSLEEQKRLQKVLPMTSTGDDKEGPVACGFFGWAAEATHRFMDNSHKGEPRLIHGLSFRLDYREHNTIGRTWDNITIKVAHGNWSSIKYNSSREYELQSEPTVVFNKAWSFPTLKGYPALKPAEWGGPQNCLNFQFDKPFAYNGKDAIFIEFAFNGGETEDKVKAPYGFEVFLDSMPEAGGWRLAEKPKGIYRAPRVEAVVSYTAGGQSVWTSSAKGMPYLNWDFRPSKVVGKSR